MKPIDDKVQTLQALAAERQARFYFNHRDNRYRLLYPGKVPALITFGHISEAEKLLNTPGAAVVYYGDRPPVERPAPVVYPERPRGVEIPRVLSRVTSRVMR